MISSAVCSAFKRKLCYNIIFFLKMRKHWSHSIAQIISHLSSAVSIVYKTNSWSWNGHKLAEVTQSHFFHASDSIGRMAQKFHVQRKDWYIHEELLCLLNRKVLLRGWNNTSGERNVKVKDPAWFALHSARKKYRKQQNLLKYLEHLSYLSYMLCWVLSFKVNSSYRKLMNKSE